MVVLLSIASLTKKIRIQSRSRCQLHSLHCLHVLHAIHVFEFSWHFLWWVWRFYFSFWSVLCRFHGSSQTGSHTYLGIFSFFYRFPEWLIRLYIVRFLFLLVFCWGAAEAEKESDGTGNDDKCHKEDEDCPVPYSPDNAIDNKLCLIYTLEALF